MRSPVSPQTIWAWSRAVIMWSTGFRAALAPTATASPMYKQKPRMNLALRLSEAVSMRRIVMVLKSSSSSLLVSVWVGSWEASNKWVSGVLMGTVMFPEV
eukprot:29604_4